MNIKNITTKTKCGLAKAAVTAQAFTAMVTTGITARASGLIDPVTVDADKVSAIGLEGLMGGIIGLILTIIRYVGIVLLIYGIYQTVMAWKDDNANEKVKGVTLCIISIVLIVLKSVMITMGLVS